ncbi:FBP domain-containing protein [Antiquaquibacter soli]|uniref:FBP domain-containing protein n=1 Tax=Antiquaquibacter soli TaxID=3064523 RepID=A0ABT9BST4_9MICO|nr:FBP domain-containing protein [Protaetiibacter sp. WY-16]MDO7882402.1 FBP domain-containing protein [Protaetiibacter sp. WY-16]
MKPLSPTEIRESFVNASQGESERIPLPGLHEVLWDDREYLGWRDPQARQRGYLVYWRGDTPVGIVLRASESALRPGISAMCSLCRITQPSDQVTLFSAPRAGQAGRDGSTVGTYICDDLACSHLIRILPPASDMQPSPEEILAGRSESLVARVEAFTSDVMRTA